MVRRWARPALFAALFAPSLAHGATNGQAFADSIAHPCWAHVFGHLDALGLAVGLTSAALLGKLACGLGTARGVSRLSVAFGMIPRGEVSLVYASLGMTLTIDGSPLLDKSGYSALVAVVILTTVLTPLLLRWQLARDERRAA